MIRYVKQYGDAMWLVTRSELADYLLSPRSKMKPEPYRPLG
jgi:hypothetical protein